MTDTSTKTVERLAARLNVAGMDEYECKLTSKGAVALRALLSERDALRAEVEKAWNTRAPQWQDIEAAPRDSTRMLLSITIDGTRHVATGGWDDHWTGNCWVFDSKRVPSDTNPTHWMPLPSPPQEAGE